MVLAKRPPWLVWVRVRVRVSRLGPVGFTDVAHQVGRVHKSF